MDDSVRNEREAEQILGAPVLSGVPEILNPQQLWHNALRVCTVGVVTVVFAIGLGIGLAQFSCTVPLTCTYPSITSGKNPFG